MARIGAAHGIRGEVRVKPFGDDPLSFTDYGPLVTQDGKRCFDVQKARIQKTVVITQFVGIKDRNQAEELNGIDLYVYRHQLPDPEEDDEFYHTDLTGLAVQDPFETPLGVLVAVQDFGAGDLLEIRPQAGKTFYVPFTKAYVPSVNLENGVVTVDLPKDYFSESTSEDLSE